MLLHLVTIDPSEGREPLADYLVLRKELARFDKTLAKRPEVVALSKADIPEVREAYPKLKKAFAKKKIALHLVSAATGEGVRELMLELWKAVAAARKKSPPSRRAPRGS